MATPAARTTFAAVPPEAADVLRPALPGLADEMIAAISIEVPDYARAMEGDFGQVTIRRVATLEKALADRAKEPVKSLSKGNQQKIQLATTVLHAPKLALLDEPFSGLDPLNQEMLMDIIREMRKAGTTVLFSAHQMPLVERLADRVLAASVGWVAEIEPTSAIRGAGEAASALRSPVTRSVVPK